MGITHGIAKILVIGAMYFNLLEHPSFLLKYVSKGKVVDFHGDYGKSYTYGRTNDMPMLGSKCGI